MAYPMFDALVVFLTTLIFFLYEEGSARSLFRGVALGVLVYAFSDILYVAYVEHGIYYTGGLSSMLLFMGFALMAYSIYTFRLTTPETQAETTS